MRLAILFALVLIGATSVGALANSDATPEASPEAVSTGAVFLKISNGGDADDRLVGGSSDVAETLEMHETLDEDGVMRMSPLEAIDIPAGETVELAPGGLHLMLIGLNQNLEAGTTLQLTLEFEIAGSVEMEVPILMSEMEAMDAELGMASGGDLEISGAWSRQAPAMGGMDHSSGDMDGDSMNHDDDDMDHDMGGSTGAVYLQISNSGDEDDKLIAGQTDVAEVVEIHEVADVDGVMQMRPLGEGLEIPAGETVSLEPGGYHVMLIGLTQDLKADETFAITLRFERAGDVEVEARIVMGNTPPDDGFADDVEVEGIVLSDVWSRAAPMIE